MTQEIALRNETNLAGLATFAQDNDAVLIAGDAIFYKKGEFYKADQAFDTKDRHFLANYQEAYTGWTRWADKKPVDHRLVRCSEYQRKEPREALGFTDKNQWQANDRGVPQDPWQPSDRLVLRTMDSGEDLLTFITGSVGGRNAIAKLLGKVARSAQAAEGKMPVVVLESGTYDHADYGVVHYPIFRVIDWAYWDGREVEQIASGATPTFDDDLPFAPEWRA
jgi:hypothetical protein